MIAADISSSSHRPVEDPWSTDQCVPVFTCTEVPAVEIVPSRFGVRANHNDYVLIDTAGRLQIDEKLMGELRDVKALG